MYYLSGRTPDYQLTRSGRIPGLATMSMITGLATQSVVLGSNPAVSKIALFCYPHDAPVHSAV